MDRGLKFWEANAVGYGMGSNEENRMTKLERQMLQAICDSEYQLDRGNPVDDQVWTFSAYQDFEPTSVGGIVASLTKKGFAGIEEGYVPDYDRIWITQAGFDALRAAS